MGGVLRESPEGNLSWAEPDMVDLMQQAGVYSVNRRCAGSARGPGTATGPGLVKQQPWHFTNSVEMAAELHGTRDNASARKGGAGHRHVHLVDPIAKAAEVYPPGLVKAVLMGHGGADGDEWRDRPTLRGPDLRRECGAAQERGGPAGDGAVPRSRQQGLPGPGFGEGGASRGDRVLSQNRGAQARPEGMLPRDWAPASLCPVGGYKHRGRAGAGRACRPVARPIKTQRGHATFASTPPLELLKHLLAFWAVNLVS